MELDVVRLWKTLMRTRINDSFSTIRLRFFMEIARTGNRTYKGYDVLDNIIEDSRVFKINPDFVEGLKKAIGPDDTFKHYVCATEDDLVLIEYFANITSGITKEYLDYIMPNHKPEYVADGFCQSASGKEKSIIESAEVIKDVTTNLIIIGENKDRVTPDTYPKIIKHELTHVCIYELRRHINAGLYSGDNIPSYWTDEEKVSWNNDIIYLYDVLSNESDDDCKDFVEFVCEFLMFESDGQIKVKVPPIESRIPKKVNPETKPKVVYRAVTPFDAYREYIDNASDSYAERYSPILEKLRPIYEDYSTFLEELRIV